MYKQLENRLFMNSNEKYEWINRCVAVFSLNLWPATIVHCGKCLMLKETI